jgi:hypothetical protein
VIVVIIGPFGSRGLLAPNPKCSAKSRRAVFNIASRATDRKSRRRRADVLAFFPGNTWRRSAENPRPAAPQPSPPGAIAGVGRALSSRPPAAARRRADARAGEAALRQDLGKNTLEHLQGGSALVAEAEDALRAPDAG